MGNTMNHHIRTALCLVLVALFCTQTWQPLPTNPLLVEPTTDHAQGGPAVRIAIASPVYSVTSDEVVMFEATLYDAVNNVVSGQINWSVANGSISQDGTFYPWQAGVVGIEASSGTLVDVFNITVTAGIGQTLQIITTSAHAEAPTTLEANVLDARGNPKPATDVVWTIDGSYVGIGSP